MAKKTNIVTKPVILVFIVIIGGIGTIEGPIVGSFIYVLLSQWLAEYGHISMLLLGVIAITIILAAPKGIVGTLQEKTGFTILSARRIMADQSFQGTNLLK